MTKLDTNIARIAVAVADELERRKSKREIAMIFSVSRLTHRVKVDFTAKVPPTLDATESGG